MTADELAVRFHHRVVKIRPFRNGNGRHARLLADVVLSKHLGREPFTWGGSAQLGTGDRYGQAYLEGLKAADRGDYGPLMGLCRAS
jgi:fido (protein-threonine AMPylation protein)